MFWKIADPFAGDLLHDLLELALQHNHGVVTAFGSQRTDAVHEGAPHESELGPACNGVGHVGSVPEPAVDHQGGLASKFFGQSGERFDRGLADIQLPSAVIGDDHAIHTQFDGLFSVLGIDDPFDHKLALPAMAEILSAVKRPEKVLFMKSPRCFILRPLGM